MPRSRPLPASFGSADEIEQQFYEAMRTADLERLMSVWSDDDDIVCVHPGGIRLVGSAAIRASFEAMFASGAIDIALHHVRRVETHSSSVHSVLERVQSAAAEGAQQAFVIATNVYVQTTQGWRLVLHHASPGTVRESDDVVEAAATLH